MKLQDDLAKWLGQGTKPWLAFTEMPLGSVTRNAGMQRADVLAINFSYNTRVRIYECKISRGDFHNDIHSGKYEGYLSHCHQLYFATPKGLITKEELPPGTGLIVHSENGWHTIKAPYARKFDIPTEMLLACLFRKHELAIETRRLSERINLDENVELSQRAKNLGFQIAQRINNVSREWASLDEIKEEINQLTGGDSRDIREAIYALKSYLHSSLPGMTNIETAVDLVQIASALVLNPNGGIENHFAFERLREFVEREGA